MKSCPLVLLSCVALASTVPSQAVKPNYDESKVPSYQLPDPLVCVDGAPVGDAAAWRERRRPEILALFEEQMYGRVPRRAPVLSFEPGESAPVLDGKAVRREVVIRCAVGERAVELTLLLYVPASAEGPVPAFLGLNFGGNHTVQADPAIGITRSWVRGAYAGKGNRAGAASRGMKASRWPVEMVVERGYALATVYYGDIDPDFDDGFRNGVHGLFEEEGERAGGAWGSIAAWAWGLGRALDYLATDDAVDASRVAVVGHSRLGKTALWAGAVDERFALVISNDSGCGGAALSKRCFGETVARITKVFPHWFCGNFRGYAGREAALPFDQHMLVALVAPRPVLICSATDDRWADPRGEFLSALHAAPVYELLGAGGIDAEAMPEPGVLVKSRVGYHLRSGRHDMTVADWKAWLTFADHHGLRGR